MQLVETLQKKGAMRPRPFDDAEYARRLEVVKERMAAEGLDVLLCSNTASIGYLTGYDVTMPSGYSVLIVAADGTTTLHCSEIEGAAMLDSGKVDNIEVFDWFKAQSTGADLARILQDHGLGGGRIGVEMGFAETFSIGAFDTKSYLALADALPSAEFVDSTLLVMAVREIKTAAEIEHLKTAGTYTGAGLRAGVDAVAADVQDNVIAAAAFHGSLAAGSELMSIDPMVISGPRTGFMPHAVFRREVPGVDEPVYFELTGTHYRYNVPSMRTAVTGKPSAQVQAMADASMNTVRFLIENIKPGVSCDELAQEAGKQLYVVDGLYFHGSFGYSIGMGFQPHWTEAPLYIAVGSDRVLEEGMCFHLPICILVPGERGLGFSECITVTADGCELLTPMERFELAIR
jgi:Xaa-Pro aminopeptidase